MPTHSSPLLDAIRDLAHDANINCSGVSTAKAIRAANPDVCLFWLSHALGTQSIHQVLGDVLAENMTEGDAKNLFILMMGDRDPGDHESFMLKAGRKLHDTLRGHVADYLVQEAELLVAQFDPCDREMRSASYAHEVDDPIIGDRRALARESRL
jgi:hypothetical protein